MHRRALTLKEKIEVIEYHKREKCSIRKLAKDWKIGKTQASDIIKNTEILMNLWCENGNDYRYRMSPLSSPGYQIDKSVFEWFLEVRNKKIPVSGPMLQTKALEIACYLGRVGFKASNGWLERFRRRHMISFKTINGESGTMDLDSECLREAVAEVITADGASSSRVQSYDSLRTSLYKYKERNKMQKKAGKSCSTASDQNNKDPNPLPSGNEVSTPDVEMQCSESTYLETQGVASTSFMSNTDEQMNEGSLSIPDEKEVITPPDVEMQCFESTEMKTQNEPSTGFLNSSNIVFKREIIETELDPCTFDDSSFHSSIAGPSGMQFDEQRPSTSYQTFSESSNSNTDYILPDEPDNVVGISPTLSHGLRTVKVESDVSANSRDVISETNKFYSGPSIINVTKPVSLTRDKFIQTGVPPLVLNIADPKDSPSNVPVQNGVTSHTESPTLTQVLDRTGYEESCNNKSIQTEVSTHSSSDLPPRDKFDVFGEFIASKLRNLDPKSSGFVQTAFSELLFKAELEMFLNRNEKSNSSIQIDGIQKDMLLSNESEIAHGPPGKENIQPVVPPLMGNSDFSILSSESSSRNDIPQSEVLPHKAKSSFQPIKNNTGPENAVRNEPIQPRVTPHIGNKRPSVVPERSSNETRASSHAVSPAFLPDLNSANFSRNQPIQPIVPFRGRPRDEFDAYGEFTASKLRDLDRRSCAFVQTAFADLIFEAELGRFLSEGEKSIFTNKTNDFLRKMPSANGYGDTSQASVVSNSSKYDARPMKDFVTPIFYECEVPWEMIPSTYSIHK